MRYFHKLFYRISNTLMKNDFASLFAQYEKQKPNNVYVGTENEMTQTMHSFFVSLGNREKIFNSISVSREGLVLAGGHWDVFTSRTTIDFGYQIAIGYTGLYIMYRYRSNGGWSNWTDVSNL